MFSIDENDEKLDTSKEGDINDKIVQQESCEATDPEAEEIVVNEDGVIQKSNKKKSKSGKPSKIKGAFSELKKVTWPTFGRVVKETIVVLSVTAVFLVVIFGIDRLLKVLFDFLTGNMGA